MIIHFCLICLFVCLFVFLHPELMINTSQGRSCYITSNMLFFILSEGDRVVEKKLSY